MFNLSLIVILNLKKLCEHGAWSFGMLDAEF